MEYASAYAYEVYNSLSPTPTKKRELKRRDPPPLFGSVPPSTDKWYGVMLTLVQDYEKECTARRRLEAECDELRRQREAAEMAREDVRVKRVSFADGSVPAPGFGPRRDEQRLVPESLLLSAESHCRGLQRKLDSCADQTTALETKLESEMAARLDAESQAANSRMRRSKPPTSCPVCYTAYDGPPRRLPCCGATACVACFRDAYEDGNIHCGECFACVPMPDFEAFLSGTVDSATQTSRETKVDKLVDKVVARHLDDAYDCTGLLGLLVDIYHRLCLALFFIFHYRRLKLLRANDRLDD